MDGEKKAKKKEIKRMRIKGEEGKKKDEGSGLVSGRKKEKEMKVTLKEEKRKKDKEGKKN